MIAVKNPNRESGIMKELAEKLYSMEDSNQNKVLIVSKYTERTRVNLLLLKFFLQERGQRGIFITIDRPHQYIAYLLKLHGICQKKLIFLDAVSRISGECHSEKETNVCFMNGPYEVDFLRDITTQGFTAGDIPKPEIELEDIGFILIDDVAAFQKYNSTKVVEKLMISYLSTIESLKNVMAIIVLDVNKNKHLYKIITKNSDKVILVNLSNTLVKNIKAVSTTRPSSSQHALKIGFTTPKVVGG